MTMPLLPGLMGTAPAPDAEPGLLTDLLDSMGEQEIAQLVAQAGGEPNEEPTEEAPDSEPGDEAPDSAAGEEEAPAPDAEGEPTEEIKAGVEAALAAIEGSIAELGTVLKEATAAKEAGGDPDSIEDLLAEATSLQEDAIAESKGASGSDPEEVAQAGLLVREKAELIGSIVEQARVLAKANRPVAPSAIAMWAERAAS